MRCSRGREVVEDWEGLRVSLLVQKRIFFEMEKWGIVSDVYVLSRWGREAGF